MFDTINKIKKILPADVPTSNEAESIYRKMYASCLEYQKNSKLHWNTEADGRYSDIVFSKLSQSLKMEKSPCQASGISLSYREGASDCSYQFGVYNCSCKLSVSARSCKGVEYFLLESDAEGMHQKKELSMEELQKSLKSANFFKKWENKIKELMPLCE